MEKYTFELLAEMNVALQQVSVSALHPLQRAKQSFFLIEDSMQKLKGFMTAYTFKSRDEEIRFFKEIKPSFQKELFYFEQLYHIESTLPGGPQKANQKYFKQALERFHNFFNENRALYTYYLSGETAQDEDYFVRSVTPSIAIPVSGSDMDANFTTICGYKYAKFQAYEQLTEMLNRRLSKDGCSHENADHTQKSNRNLTWTDTKAALIELAYAIHARGSVNFGKSDIKQLVTDLEALFNVRLGNVYRVYLGMSIRKKSRTPYLDVLKETLERKLDQDDE